MPHVFGIGIPLLEGSKGGFFGLPPGKSMPGRPLAPPARASVTGKPGCQPGFRTRPRGRRPNAAPWKPSSSRLRGGEARTIRPWVTDQDQPCVRARPTLAGLRPLANYIHRVDPAHCRDGERHVSAIPATTPCRAGSTTVVSTISAPLLQSPAQASGRAFRNGRSSPRGLLAEGCSRVWRAICVFYSRQTRLAAGGRRAGDRIQASGEPRAGGKVRNPPPRRGKHAAPAVDRVVYRAVMSTKRGRLLTLAVGVEQTVAGSPTPRQSRVRGAC